MARDWFDFAEFRPTDFIISESRRYREAHEPPNELHIDLALRLAARVRRIRGAACSADFIDASIMYAVMSLMALFLRASPHFALYKYRSHWLLIDRIDSWRSRNLVYRCHCISASPRNFSSIFVPTSSTQDGISRLLVGDTLCGLSFPNENGSASWVEIEGSRTTIIFIEFIVNATDERIAHALKDD